MNPLLVGKGLGRSEPVAERSVRRRLEHLAGRVDEPAVDRAAGRTGGVAAPAEPVVHRWREPVCVGELVRPGLEDRPRVGIDSHRRGGVGAGERGMGLGDRRSPLRGRDPARRERAAVLEPSDGVVDRLHRVGASEEGHLQRRRPMSLLDARRRCREALTDQLPAVHATVEVRLVLPRAQGPIDGLEGQQRGQVGDLVGLDHGRASDPRLKWTLCPDIVSIMNASAVSSKPATDELCYRTGILGFGAYLPAHRLDLSAIRATLGSGGAKGTRAVAGYDEDTTSMAVEAARTTLRGTVDVPASIVLATTTPAYVDKTNATAVHAALALPVTTGAYDAGGAARSTAGALRAALRSTDTTLVVGADIRAGRPGSVDEATGGDGAAAVLIGDGPDVLAELVGVASISAEFLDRWRTPGDDTSRVWEERFGETAYLPLADAVVTDALKHAGLALDDVDLAVVSGLHRRATGKVRAGLAKATTVVDAETGIGATGAAGILVGLAATLDDAAPGQVILALSLADGADAFVFRTTAVLDERRSARPVRAMVESGRPVDYATVLTWRGFLVREQPRRPEPDAPAAPPSARTDEWKFGFHGSRCVTCDTRHLPPQRVCMRCGSIDQMTIERLTEVLGTVVTYTIDHLAPSLQPPVVAAVIDLDGGGRVSCELTDVDPTAVAVGDRVGLTFRRLHTSPSTGIHNYFWKATPLSGRADLERGEF